MKFVAFGLLLVSAAIILLQIALTRVFAIMMWHHLTYMVISIALLGFGAAGSILTVARVSEKGPRAERSLSLLAAAFGLSVQAAYFVATNISVDTLEIWKNQWNLATLALLYGTVFVPFLLGGATVGTALTRLSAHVDRLYFYDLVGSALGGGASVWLLTSLGSTSTVLAAGAIGALGSVVFALGADRRTRVVAITALTMALTILWATDSGLISSHIPYAPGKEFASLNDDLASITRIYGATAEVEIGDSGPWLPIIGGDIGKRSRRFTIGRPVGQDGTAPTMLYQKAGDLDRFPFLDGSSTRIGLIAHRAAGGASPRVLVIGVGGGVDVMIALRDGASRVTAVEVNSAMIDMVQDHFDDYIGGLFRPDAHAYSNRVELVHGEGRSYVRSSEETFDVIQLSGVDSFTALSTGAYTLSEGYLYTTEAVRDFYEHLAPGGYIVYSRFVMIPPQRPRETLRLVNIAREALVEIGVSDPAAQILVMRGYRWASTVIKRGAFSESEVAAVRDFATDEGFWGMLFDPFHQAGTPYPATRSAAPGVREDFSTLLRGSDAERRDLISNYPYDLSPSTDDSPFFFNYYKYSEVFGGVRPNRERLDRWEHYHPDYPVGHVVLLASLLQISMLAALLILLPLKVMGGTRILSTAHIRVFAYFAALGAGFMLIEIALMQKLVLFLGHPIYALTVVLTALLLAAGFGSLLSGRIEEINATNMRRLLAGILAMLALDIFALNVLLPELLHLSLPWRVASTVLLLLPLGLLLGMPFPLGMRFLSQRSPELLSWAWGINGFLSVFASIFCIVLAMLIGFSLVLVFAGCIYAAGLLALVPSRESR